MPFAKSLAEKMELMHIDAKVRIMAAEDAMI